jgi:glycosyltransferase involved in cell wall biosynthesis
MARSTPLVSIGLPVYNGGRYLRETLDSLLSQTFIDFELVVCDNASTDNTGHICREYAAQDSRIRYLRNETNVGIYRNCNRVIELAIGKYFKLAAADDLCHPTLLARCVEVLEANPDVVATYAKTRFIDADGDWLPVEDPGWHLISDDPRERLGFVLVSGHYVNVFFGMVRKEALSKTRLFPLYPGGDCSLLGELSLEGKFVELPDYLFFRRFHPAAASQNNDPEWQSVYYTGRSGGAEMPLFRVCFDHLRTILNSRLSLRQKASCLGVMGRRMLHSRHSLVDELRIASKRRLSAVLTRQAALKS